MDREIRPGGRRLDQADRRRQRGRLRVLEAVRHQALIDVHRHPEQRGSNDVTTLFFLELTVGVESEFLGNDDDENVIWE